MITKPRWKKGRGKLWILAPLVGTWHADADTPDGRPGKVHCVRSFQKVLNGSYVGLTATWHMGDTVYEERALLLFPGVISPRPPV
jgi:hypothetical protein